ncbi:hypothetical protein JCM10908_001689 [Rhodotorula pacifica]|uniref:uncharacterized protein n=1 Tax=Rhodotorula pacifica TaxID=1495444 RepID=UPI0031745C11
MSLGAAGGNRVSRSTCRTSVSFKPTDDPFAAPTPVEATFDADWHRIDEEQEPEHAERTKTLRAGEPEVATNSKSGRLSGGSLPRRRSSFLRSLFPSISSFSSSSSSTATAKPRRTRSAAQLSISGPLQHAAPPPVVAPATSVAALVPLGIASSAATASAQSSSYPSGTNSLRQRPATTTPVTRRSSFGNLFRRSVRRSDEPLEATVEEGEVGLALTTDEIADAALSTQQSRTPSRAALSSSVSSPQARSSTAPTTRSPSALSGDLSPAQGQQPALTRVPIIAYTAATPAATPATRKSGHARSSTFELPASLAPGQASPRPASAAGSDMTSLSRPESRASVRSIRSYGPAPPRPPRSPARPPSRNQVHPVSSTLPRGSAAGSATREAGASGCLAAPISSAQLQKKPSRVSFAPTEPKDPLVSAYLVVGLAKDPYTWVPVPRQDRLQDDPVRRWRAEVLDTLTDPEDAHEGKEPDHLRYLSKEESERVQQRIRKLAFPHDIDLTFAAKQPPATTTFFHFSTTASPTDVPQYHATALHIWSRADPLRRAAITSILRTKRDNSVDLLRQATETLKQGRRLSSRLERQMHGEGSSDAHSDAEISEGSAKTTAPDTPQQSTCFEDDDADLPAWIPYTIVLVSRYPIYSLLSDVLRLSWAQNHRNLDDHTRTMRRLLTISAPRPGEALRVPVSILPEHSNTFFRTTMPGSIDWISGGVLHRNFPVWPIFKTLHGDNLLSIAELALAPLGKIVFLSRHPFMLSLAVMNFQVILELHGWRGLVLPVAHVADLEVYLEDPGPWLLAVPFSARSLLRGVSAAVAIVDLDNDVLSCKSPHANALSKGAARTAALRRLEEVIGYRGPHQTPSLVEAFRNGRFSSVSEIEADGAVRDAERIVADWPVNDYKVLRDFARIVSDARRYGLVDKVLRLKQPRKSADLDPAAIHAQSSVRRQLGRFVQRRDLLEGELDSANRKFAALVEQSAEWQTSLSIFREFFDDAARRSSNLQQQLQNAVSSDAEQQAMLSAQLQQVDEARQSLAAELARVKNERERLAQQRDNLAAEISDIVRTGQNSAGRIYQSMMSQSEVYHSSEASPRPASALSMRDRRQDAVSLPQQQRELPNSIAEEDEDALDYIEVQDHADAMLAAFQETFDAISARLVCALQSTAVEVIARESADLSSATTSSPQSAISSDSTLVTSTSGPQSASSSPAAKIANPLLPFQPKRLTLTPPVSPDEGCVESMYTHVTLRNHRRDGSANSAGGNSIASFRSRGSPVSSQATPRPCHRRQPSTISRHSQSTPEPDDASFVSASEGWGQSRRASRVGTPAVPSSHTVEELAVGGSGDDVEPRTPEAHPRALQHTRQASWSIDAPPVPLFTRSNSVRGRIETPGRVKAAVQRFERNPRA